MPCKQRGGAVNSWGRTHGERGGEQGESRGALGIAPKFSRAALVCGVHQCQPREARGGAVRGAIGGTLPAAVCLLAPLEGPSCDAGVAAVSGLRLCAPGAVRSVAPAASPWRGEVGWVQWRACGTSDGRNRGAEKGLGVWRACGATPVPDRRSARANQGWPVVGRGGNSYSEEKLPAPSHLG